MELIPNKNLPRTAYCEPAVIRVEPGKIYSWCSCGLTKETPFCDSTHKNIEGMPLRSVKVVFEKEEEIFFCQCKKTKTPPFCDDSHLQVKL
jgi:CDGSH iron-sulfur domain-containing protein 3